MFAHLLVVSFLSLLWLIRQRRWRRLQRQPSLEPSVTASDLNSSSSNGRYSYKVFSSFTGVDVHGNFLSHLYKELKVKGIYTFKDDPALKRGDSISQALKDAISGSAISVFILSENYASSSWCLEELDHIMKCKKSTGQVVIPIFYKVDPSDVKKQRGSFGDAMRAHVEGVKHRHNYNYEEEMEKIRSWRCALTEVGKIAGWDSRGSEEAPLIENIVRDILDKLIYCCPSSRAEDLVGIGSQVIKIEKMVDNQKDVNMIGIWGMGGIGKTTLARVVYDKIRPQYEACCFLRNVNSKFKAYGTVSLQKEILSKLLLERNLDIWPLDDDDSSLIRDRLGGKKVLIVLDDVNSLDQLNALARSPDWFGFGSTIIITTQDKHLLDLHKVDGIYQVDYLGKDDALKLFSKHAFQQYQIKKDFVMLAREFVAYAKGLPLALKVVGSFLYGRSISVWQDEFNKLRSIPEAGVFDVLKPSFDTLEDNEKNVFLVLAIFFTQDIEMDCVRCVLQHGGMCPDRAFSILISKALISTKMNRIVMHDMLRQMGHEIACRESANLIEQRWLWSPKDVQYVLTKKKGTELIRGISLDLSKASNMKLEEDAFIGMGRLQILNMYCSYGKKVQVHLPVHGIQINSNELVYLHWDGYLQKSLSICAPNLVELNLCNSKIKRLWKGSQEFVNLTRLNLSGSRYLTATPDLSLAKKIEYIDFSSCESLVEVHSSFEQLQHLVDLRLQYCPKLKTVPSRLNSKVLGFLQLTSCSKLRKCPDLISEQLIWLDLRGSGVEKLPNNLSRQTNLAVISIQRCNRLLCIPQLPPKLMQLEAYDRRSLQYFNHKFDYNIPKRCLKFDLTCPFKVREQAHNIVSAALFTLCSTKEGDKILFVISSIQMPPSFPNPAVGSSVTIQASPEFMAARMLLCCVVFESKYDRNINACLRCRCQLKGDSNQPGHFAYQEYDFVIPNNSLEQMMVLCNFDKPEALHQCGVGDEILFEFVTVDLSYADEQIEVVKSCAIAFLPSREDD